MSRSRVQSLGRALALLTALAERPGAAGVTSLAHQLGLPRSTVHRLLATLEEADFVVREPGRRYRLGSAARTRSAAP